MAKHGRARKEKDARNALYAMKYKQLRCEECKHRSCRPVKIPGKRGPRCVICTGKMK